MPHFGSLSLDATTLASPFPPPEPSFYRCKKLLLLQKFPPPQQSAVTQVSTAGSTLSCPSLLFESPSWDHPGLCRSYAELWMMVIPGDNSFSHLRTHHVRLHPPCSSAHIISTTSTMSTAPLSTVAARGSLRDQPTHRPMLSAAEAPHTTDRLWKVRRWGRYHVRWAGARGAQAHGRLLRTGFRLS